MKSIIHLDPLVIHLRYTETPVITKSDITKWRFSPRAPNALIIIRPQRISGYNEGIYRSQALRYTESSLFYTYFDLFKAIACPIDWKVK